MPVYAHATLKSLNLTTSQISCSLQSFCQANKQRSQEPDVKKGLKKLKRDMD